MAFFSFVLSILPMAKVFNKGGVYFLHDQDLVELTWDLTKLSHNPDCLFNILVQVVTYKLFNEIYLQILCWLTVANTGLCSWKV